MKRKRQLSHACGFCSGVLAVLCCFVGTGPLATPVFADQDKASRYYEDALRRFEKGDLPGTTIQLKNALQQDGRMLAAHLLLGKTLVKLGQLQPAEAALDEALRLGVDRGEVAVALGQIYLLQGTPKLVIDRITPDGLPADVQAEVLTLRGTAYGDIGNLVASAKAFEEARALHPISSGPLVAEASVRLKNGKQGEALALADRATTLTPDDTVAWSTLGAVRYAGDDVQAALVAYDRSLAIDPGNAEARMTRANILLGMKRLAEAEKDIGLLPQLQRQDPRVSYLQAQIAGARGDAAARSAALRRVVDKLDAMPKAYLLRREDLLMAGALAHYALRNWDSAKEYLVPIATRSNRNLVARKVLASIYVQRKEHALARSELETLLDVVPKDSQVQFMLGSVYLTLGQYAKAADLLERAVREGSVEATRELGLSQLALGRDGAGVANLEKAFAGGAGESQAGIELAAMYLRTRQFKRAVQTAQAVARANPDNIGVINFVGTVNEAAGDRKAAREAYRRVLAKDPDFRPSLLNLARIDRDESRFAEARTTLTKLLAKRPEDADLLYELGALEVKARMPDEAIRYWQKASEVQSGNIRPGLALVELLGREGQTDQMLVQARQLVAQYPDNLAARIALGRAYVASRDLAGAHRILQTAARQDNLDTATRLQVGRELLNAGSPDGAAEVAQKALQAKPDDEAALTLLIEASTARGAGAEADRAFKRLSEKYRDRAATMVTGGNLAMARGQYANAIDSYRAALKRQPTTAIAINVAQAHVALKEFGKAIAFTKEWLQQHPGDSSVRKALAELQMRSGDLAAAKATYDQVLSVEPDDPLSLNNLAVVLLSLDDPRSIDMAHRARRLAPKNPEIADSLGWILVRNGKVEDGLTYLREARLRNPENRETRFHLAFALARTGRKAEARDELAAALRGPNAIEVRDEVSRLKAELGL